MKAVILNLIFVLSYTPIFAAEGDGADKKTKDVKESEKAKEPKAAKVTVKDEDGEEDTDHEISQILDSMGYPELQVVPRASERLRIESKIESSNWYVQHWPVELSGLATLYVGYTANSHLRSNLNAQDRDYAKTVQTLSKAIGAGWLIGGIILGAQRPYLSGVRSIAKYSGNDQRSDLTRERLAEEALQRPADTMKVLQHFSVLSNFTLNALNMAYVDEEGRVISAVAATLAFLPYMFEDHTVAVFNKHIEYKKKIYAPIKTGGLSYDPESRTYTPMTYLVWAY